MQHMYAFIFAGTITASIAGAILYSDYGFWHERYERQEEIAINKEENLPPAPTEVVSRFLGEVQNRLKSITTGTTSLLEGKEVFTR